MPSSPEADRDRARWGLCARCRHHIAIVSDRGSRFVQCGLARADPRFPKYPVVPVQACAGYDPDSDPGGAVRR